MILNVFVLLLSASIFVGADLLDDAARKVCLSFHNQNRRALANGQVQNGKGQMMPKATDMNQMKYSKELEQKSQESLKLCRTINSGGRGQISSWTVEKSDHATLIRKMLTDGWNQVKNYHSTGVKYSKDMFMKSIRQFPQMAYSKNTAVGCAIGSCYGGSYIVCSYDQVIVVKDEIYKPGGEPCIDCDPTRKYCQRGLCSKCALKS